MQAATAWECDACRGFPGMIKSAAIAHIVTGVVQRRPALVGQGEALLQACPQVCSTAQHA